MPSSIPRACLEQVELFVLVDHFLRHPVGVERFSAQRKHGLGIDVASFGDGSTRRVPLGDEERRFVGELVLGV